MVKKRFKFIIVPHQPDEKPRGFKFPVIISLIILLGIAVAISIFFKNLSYYVDVTSIPEMEEDNKLLREKLIQLKKDTQNLQQKLDSLKHFQKKILERHKLEVYKESEEETTENLDTLLLKAGITEGILKKALDLVKDGGKYIPSILPAGGVIVKRFGRSWDPYTEKWKRCNGIDIAAPEGTPVVATANGVVSKTGKDSYLGNFVEIKHGKKYTTLYGHLKTITVKEGEKVVRGKKIGSVGKTGKTPYPVLYYQVMVDGNPEDPENFIPGGNNDTH